MKTNKKIQTRKKAKHEQKINRFRKKIVCKKLIRLLNRLGRNENSLYHKSFTGTVKVSITLPFFCNSTDTSWRFTIVILPVTPGLM